MTIGFTLVNGNQNNTQSFCEASTSNAIKTSPNNFQPISPKPVGIQNVTTYPATTVASPPNPDVDLNVNNNNNNIEIPSGNLLVPLEPDFDDALDDDADLLKILANIEEENLKQIAIPQQSNICANITKMQNNQNILQKPSDFPMFNNCHIGNITFNISRK